MVHKIWQPPHLHRDINPEEERKVTWLELFYDLVYVATLIQLGNTLSEEVTLMGFAQFAIVFTPIWWTWTGVTFYMNRFVVDDIWHRLLIFVQMCAIAWLGVSVEGAFGELAGQFALSTDLEECADDPTAHPALCSGPPHWGSSVVRVSFFACARQLYLVVGCPGDRNRQCLFAQNPPVTNTLAAGPAPHD